MLKTLTGGVSAGVLVAIGGSVFLACDNRYVGAVLFAVALLCICYLGYYLFTGKIGYLLEDSSRQNLKTLGMGLACNLITTLLLGLLIRYAMPRLGDSAYTICEAKLEQSFISTLVRAAFCGVLMYLAVQIFREKNTPLGIIYCIPVFILSGFEHSIADMFYAWTALTGGGRTVVMLAVVVLGNTVGGLLVPVLKRIAGDKA